MCDSALKARCSELKRAASDLLSLYLSRREEAVAARVGAYVGLVTGPDTSAGSAGHGFPGSPSKLMHRGAGAGGGEGPAGASGEVRAVSDAASALVAYLSEVFSEVGRSCGLFFGGLWCAGARNGQERSRHHTLWHPQPHQLHSGPSSTMLSLQLACTACAVPQVSAYCPRALRPVLAALVEHLVTQLASK